MWFIAPSCHHDDRGAEEGVVKGFVLKYRAIIVPTGLVVLAVAGWFVYAFSWGNRWEGGEEKVFFVSRGQTFPVIVDSLEGKGIIRSRALFIFVSKALGGASHLMVGKYIFHSGISNAEIYQDLRTGKGSAIVPVTVPEGLQSRQQARLFPRMLGVDSARYMNIVHDSFFARSLGVETPTLEGYLLPETYGFRWQQDEKEVIRKMVEGFWKFYTDSLRGRAVEAGWTTTQVLTLASIVEGESRQAPERPLIAGVYLNRLRKGMKLDADPTIQFFLQDGPRRVLYSDLKEDNPYNTYVYPGLPPGPVNNPGKASILAVLWPSQHAYLYFVANGTGGHWFSRTLEEHERYVRMYRRIRARQHSALSLGDPAHGRQGN
jgi:UPF0755 protein